MSDIQTVIGELQQADDEKLLEQLGAYSKAYALEPAKFAAPATSVPIDMATMGPLDGLMEIGRRVLKRWQKVIYDLVCGGGEGDQDARKTILDSLKINSPEALAAAVAGVLISAFNVGPAIATIVGVLFGRLLLPAAGEVVCEYWKEQLG
ncbi:hypothetical protein [Xanthobacter autotrophicus]|uniref:hypothetical protein n=1 Tax=Xanthobacter autotrophicus TaxID=280 RepID=UPI0024A764E6|nr:hypothetical protein [Xanthobacter autotrophicus]MDI4656467.1 hypothetical protein [Xanthobacter autotrophicus]